MVHTTELTTIEIYNLSNLCILNKIYYFMCPAKNHCIAVKKLHINENNAHLCKESLKWRRQNTKKHSANNQQLWIKFSYDSHNITDWFRSVGIRLIQASMMIEASERKAKESICMSQKQWQVKNFHNNFHDVLERGGGGVRGTNKTAYDIFREQIKFGKAPKKFYAD